MMCFKRNICLKMFIQLKLIVVLLVIYQKLYVNCFFGDQNYFNLNRIDSHRTTDKINFLKQEVPIPDGVSEVFVSEIKQILDYYENPLLKLGQELIECDGSSRQYERCLKSYNRFENIETSLHRALIGLKQQFVRSAKLDSKQSKKLFNFGIPKIVDRVFDITKGYAVRIKLLFSVMKMNETTVSPNTGSTVTTEAITTSRPNTEKTTPNLSPIFIWLNGNMNGTGNGNDKSSESDSSDNDDDYNIDDSENNDNSSDDNADGDGNAGSGGSDGSA